MSQMPRALQQLKDYKYQKIPHLKEIESYLLHGDQKALNAIKKQTSPSWMVQHTLAEFLPAPTALEDEDRRALHILWQYGAANSIANWLDEHLKKEKPEEDYHAIVRAELERLKVRKGTIPTFTGRQLRTFLRGDKQPTSVGRYILALNDADFKLAVKPPAKEVLNGGLIEFLAVAAPERLRPLAEELLLSDASYRGWHVPASLIRLAGKRFEEPVAAFFNACKDNWARFRLGMVLTEFNAKKYQKATVEAARACLEKPDHNSDDAIEWLLNTIGDKTLPDAVAVLSHKDASQYVRRKILPDVVKALGKKAIPAVLAALKAGDTVPALTHLINLDDGRKHKAVIQAELENALQTNVAARLNEYLPLVTRWGIEPFTDRLWALVGHSGRIVRDNVAKALAPLGDAAIPKAREILETGKAVPYRLGAVAVLTAIGSPAALKVLEDRLDLEASDDVRDAMLVGVEAAWAASGRKITRKDVDERIARALPRMKPPALWIKEDKLPPLYYKDGEQLKPEAVRYLLYRQSRVTKVQPDIEARALYELIDRTKSGDFAVTLLKESLAASSYGMAWALTVAAMLGDDRCVPPLASAIRQWAEGNRPAQAANGVEALALLGTDAALLTVDAIALKYRTKKKKVGEAAAEAFREAAERLGITTDELGDRVVPWLGFEPGKQRIVELGERKIEVRIGMDGKLKYHDLDKNKPVASLPKTAPKEILTQLKEAGALLRETIKAQQGRLENLMVRQQRWPAARWRELFLTHPVLLPFATRLVWAAYDDKNNRIGLFRALEDRSLTTVQDEAFELPASATVGAVHPLELTDDERGSWQAHLADYEIEPPFPQLERPIARLPDEQRELKLVSDYHGTSLNALTFRGRAERLGWFRGEGGDGGSINVFWKSFPMAGIDALIGVEGMYFGIDMYSSVTLEDACFVRPEEGRRSYYYMPRNDDDARLVALKDVPPIVYSEVLGDLQKITGQKAGVEATAGAPG